MNCSICLREVRNGVRGRGLLKTADAEAGGGITCFAIAATAVLMASISANIESDSARSEFISCIVGVTNPVC